MHWDVRLWPDLLDDDERAVLRRRDEAAGTDLRPDVLVVGGGILGVATARACEEAGIGRVLLVEAEHLGAGATGGSVGLCTPEPHVGLDPEPLVDLGRPSLEGWRVLEETVPGGVGIVDLEWIGLLEDERDIVGRSPRATLIRADDVARLLPGLSRPQPAMRIADQLRVNPLRAVARIAATLRAVATGVRATRVRVSGGAVRAVETTAGAISPLAVVFATGNPPVLTGVDAVPEFDAVRGTVVVTEPVRVEIQGTVDPVATQLADRRLILGGTIDDTEDPAVTRATVERLLAELTRRIPGVRGVRAERAWCCFRPHHPHGLPVIDRLAGVDNAWFTSGHYRTGVLMAPATARVLAEWITSGARPPEAASFAAPGWVRVPSNVASP